MEIYTVAVATDYALVGQFLQQEGVNLDARIHNASFGTVTLSHVDKVDFGDPEHGPLEYYAVVVTTEALTWQHATQQASAAVKRAYHDPESHAGMSRVLQPA